MEEERRRRRRGRRRGRGGHQGDRSPEEQRGLEQGQTSEDEYGDSDEAEEGDGFFWRLTSLFRRGGEEEQPGSVHRQREEHAAGARRPNVSPLSFWRRGRARSYREQPMPQQTLGRTLRRLRRMYFPPWVPVMFIILVVFGILGMLFFVRSTTGAPRANSDHWHATYSVFVCGEKQPNFPEWNAGVHTHADGIIHIHPFRPSEEGSGARLVKWFEYGRGKLTDDEMRMPGDAREFKNGDTCPDGSEAFLQVFVNGQKLDDWSRYIPQDGDRVRIVFGPEEEEGQTQGDRTIIPESEATRTVDLSLTDQGNPRGDTSFSPASLEVTTGETVKISVSVDGSTSHGVRVAGPDGEYETGDDFVSDPEIIEVGQQGTLVVRFSEAGTYEFLDPLFSQATGTIVVSGADRTLDLEISGAEADAAFNPDRLELTVGETVELSIINNGSISHSVRVAGPDGRIGTDDDFVSEPEILEPGEEGVLVVSFKKEGEYTFQDPSAPAASGTIVVASESTDAEEPETPEPDGEEADVTLEVSMKDSSFEPSQLEVKAGQTFRIVLTNKGELVHNMRIAGPDGEFETADDLMSTPEDPAAGADGELFGQIDEPGKYEFRSDFQPTEMTGAITVK